jgi:hypothetical protein
VPSAIPINIASTMSEPVSTTAWIAAAAATEVAAPAA